MTVRFQDPGCSYGVAPRQPRSASSLTRSLSTRPQTAPRQRPCRRGAAVPRTGPGLSRSSRPPHGRPGPPRCSTPRAADPPISASRRSAVDDEIPAALAAVVMGHPRSQPATQNSSGTTSRRPTTNTSTQVLHRFLAGVHESRRPCHIRAPGRASRRYGRAHRTRRAAVRPGGGRRVRGHHDRAGALGVAGPRCRSPSSSTFRARPLPARRRGVPDRDRRSACWPRWSVRDALVVVLLRFLVVNTLHAINQRHRPAPRAAMSATCPDCSASVSSPQSRSTCASASSRRAASADTPLTYIHECMLTSLHETV